MRRLDYFFLLHYIIVRPSITEISRNQTWNETNDVTLSCNATGKPPPNVTWSNPESEDMKYSESVLLLKNISREQDGDYWCTASNRVGNATASVRVTVNCKYNANESKVTNEAQYHHWAGFNRPLILFFWAVFSTPL